MVDIFAGTLGGTPRYKDPRRALEFVDQTALEFSNTLMDLATFTEGSVEKLVRATCLKVFAKIVERSPVDTGRYRSSHGISVEEPDLALLSQQKSFDEMTWRELSSDLLEKSLAFKWTVADNAIWFYNPVEYAIFLENGSSSQAPSGVYAVSLTEFDYELRQMMATEFDFFGYEDDFGD